MAPSKPLRKFSSQMSDLEIEVVGGLVEEERVGVHEQDARERDAHLPAAGQLPDVLVHAPFREAEAGEDLAGARLEAVAAQLLEASLHVAEALEERFHPIGLCRIGERVLELAQLRADLRDRPRALHGLGDDGPALHLPDVLAEVPDGDAAVHRDLALVRRLGPGDEPEEGRLAGAVRPDEAHVLAAVDDRRGADEEDLPAVLQGDVVEADHDSSKPGRAGRGRGTASLLASRRTPGTTCRGCGRCRRGIRAARARRPRGAGASRPLAPSSATSARTR